MTITIKNLADTANVDIAAIAVPVKTNFVLVDTKVDGVNREALFQTMVGLTSLSKFSLTFVKLILKMRKFPTCRARLL
jgi:hypothetical protein